MLYIPTKRGFNTLLARTRGLVFSRKKVLCRKSIDSSGIDRVSGGDDLKDSQTYTKQFGRAIATAFRDHRLAYSSAGTIDDDEVDYEPDARMAWSDDFFYEVRELLCAMKAAGPSSWSLLQD